jgi:hypothetical protein
VVHHPTGARPKVLLFELFSGIKGGRQAFVSTTAEVVGNFDSELCQFAELLSGQNWPSSSNLGDISLITECQIVDILANFVELIDLIVVLGGFPCKDTSRLKFGRKNLRGKESGKFSFFLQIMEWIRRNAKDVPVRFMVENTMMDNVAIDEVSAALHCKPWLIDAKEILACSRPRLYWTNWDFLAADGEKITHHERWSCITLKYDDNKMNILDPGCPAIT